MADDLTARIIAVLDEHYVMSLATWGSEGVHAANLFYARDHLSLCWVSDPDTRHSRDIESHARVAATVAAETDDFRTIRGLQIHGSAQRLSGAGRRIELLALMAIRYPFLRSIQDAPKALRAAFGKAQAYRLSPTDIVLIDNTKGFSHKEILRL
jgi:uncharacterized protein YhbP (UPF0306 family)